MIDDELKLPNVDPIDVCEKKFYYMADICNKAMITEKTKVIKHYITYENGFSPVCVRMWFFNTLEYVNDFPQVWQVNGLSFVWIL